MLSKHVIKKYVFPQVKEMTGTQNLIIKLLITSMKIKVSSIHVVQQYMFREAKEMNGTQYKGCNYEK